MNRAPTDIDSSKAVYLHWRSNLYVCMLGSFSTFMGMTLASPFLSIYIQSLGISNSNEVIHWSAISYVATFVVAIIAAPIWGSISDRFGNKFTLLRASLGMAIVIFFMGLVQNVYQLVGTRILLGLVGGYSSGAIILIAKQSPKSHSAWALSMLSSSALAGTLLGPLLGGVLSSFVGLRNTFLLGSSIIFISFLVTYFFIKDSFEKKTTLSTSIKEIFLDIKNPKLIAILFCTTLLILSAYMSIEPFIALYIINMIKGDGNPSLIVGLAMSSTALGSIICSPFIGKLLKKINPPTLIVVCLIITGGLLIPQALIKTTWAFILFRFLMGFSLAGLIPTITAIIRNNISAGNTGTLLGWFMSVQYLGQILGPLVGGGLATKLGLNYVFIITGLTLIVAGILNIFLIRTAKPILKI